MIQELINIIIAKNQIFAGKGYFYDPYSDGDFQGIDDCISDSFYIRKRTDSEGKEYTYRNLDGCSDVLLTCEFRLIACFQSRVKIQEAHDKLISQLREEGAILESSGTDSDKIYRTETRRLGEEDELRAKMKIVCIDFEVESVLGNECYGICIEDCYSENINVT